jgi:hypothetical protein
MSEIRTRFAPSPTGFMHVGNLRTALYAWLLARSDKGKFVLRIEDTDQNRYVEGAVDIIYSTLKQAGIDHDEGPDNGGEYGPYIQSERKPLYKEYAQKLVELGGAYYCFCEKCEESESENDEENKNAFSDGRCPGHCDELSADEVQAKLDELEALLWNGLEGAVDKWIDENLSYIFTHVAKQVYFGLNLEGYFVAYIPEGWDDIVFDTGMVYGQDTYGRLILRWDVDDSGESVNQRPEDWS